jgi:hypothetical protein
MHIEPPEGGRVVVVRVLIDQSVAWPEAIETGGPHVLNYDVCEVADQFPQKNGPALQEEIILANFGVLIPNVAYACEWAKRYGICAAMPRGVFAIGQHQPRVHRQLGMNPMAIVSPEECSFRGQKYVCGLWWCAEKRGAHLYRAESEFLDRTWFAFSDPTPTNI